MTAPQPTAVPTGRALRALAAPIAATQLAQVALSTTDTVMLGLVGPHTLAAGGLAIVLFNQIRTMGVGLITALSNQVAAAAARAGDEPTGEVRDQVRAAFLLATAAGAVGALLLVGAGAVIGRLGQDATVVAQARPMLIALAPGLLPCLWFQVIRQYTVGMRRPAALVWITLGSVGANVALNAALVYGAGWGIAGIGAATSIVYLLSFLTLSALTRRDPLLAPGLSPTVWRARPATVRRLAALGVPTAATYGSEAGFFSVVTLVIGSLGTAALAAHTAVNQLVYIVFQVTIGLSHAASILVSREMAVGRPAAAAGIARIALAHAAAVMAVVGTVYLLLPDAVLRPFFDSGAPEDGRAIAGTLLLIAAGLQFADACQNIGVGLLRGLDDARSGFRITVIGYWMIGLPLVWLLARPLGFGAPGAWLGLACGLTVTTALLLRQFRRAAVTATGLAHSQP